MKTLYKYDTKDKIRIINVSTEGAELIQESGLIDGKLIESRKVCKVKNAGKVNATTPEEQAISQMNSFITDKLTHGYFLSLEELIASKGTVIMPMLAKDYKKEKHKIDWEGSVFVQPKLDGMRCLAHCSKDGVKLISRSGKPIENMQHIENEIRENILDDLMQDLILDGELYAHGEDFQRQMELIKKFRPGETNKLIKYCMYDIVNEAPFKERSNWLLDFESNILQVVTTCRIHSEEELIDYFQQCIKEGYEGVMIRHGNDPYKKNGRSSSLLKYKDFIDETFTIINVIPSDARPEWGTPVFKTKEGKEFKSGMKYNHERRIDFLLNKDQYIGQTAEVRFFEYSNDGVPRFPVMVGIRLDK